MSDSGQRPVCLWWGDLEREEFRPARRQLRRRFQLVPADTSPPLAVPPGLLVCAVARPESPAMQRAQQAAGAWPDTRLVVLTGAWGPAAGRDAVGKRDWLSACHWSGGLDPIPPESGDALVLEPHARSVLIACRDAELGEGLAEAVGAAGWTGWWSPPGAPLCVRGPLTILWDAPRQAALRPAELDGLREAFPQARVIALVDFARHSELRELIQRGVAAALSKPVTLWELELALAGAQLAANPPGDLDIRE